MKDTAAMAAAGGAGVFGVNDAARSVAQGHCVHVQGQQEAGGSSVAAAGRSTAQPLPAQLPLVSI